MAFAKATDLFYFQPIGGQSGRGQGTKRGAPALWSFKTQITQANVDAAGFFNDLADMLSAGDLIYVVTVTNRGAANEAVVDAGWFLVNSVASGVVDVANQTAVTTTDGD